MLEVQLLKPLSSPPEPRVPNNPRSNNSRLVIFISFIGKMIHQGCCSLHVSSDANSGSCLLPTAPSGNQTQQGKKKELPGAQFMKKRVIFFFPAKKSNRFGAGCLCWCFICVCWCRRSLPGAACERTHTHTKMQTARRSHSTV